MTVKTIQTKLPVPKRGAYIVRFPNSDCFHVYLNGKHDCFNCSCNYITAKEELAKQTKQPIHFIRFI